MLDTRCSKNVFTEADLHLLRLQLISAMLPQTTLCPSNHITDAWSVLFLTAVRLGGTVVIDERSIQTLFTV